MSSQKETYNMNEIKKEIIIDILNEDLNVSSYDISTLYASLDIESEISWEDFEDLYWDILDKLEYIFEED